MSDNETYDEGYDNGYADGISKMEYDVEWLTEENKKMGNEISELVDSVSGYRDTIYELREEIETLNQKITAHRDNLYLFMCEKDDFSNLIEELQIELALIKRKNKDASIT